MTKRKNVYPAYLKAKKAKKIQDLTDTPENCNRMIEKHKKRTAGMKFSVLRIENDVHNTVFYPREGRDHEEIKSRYKQSRKY